MAVDVNRILTLPVSKAFTNFRSSDIASIVETRSESPPRNPLDATGQLSLDDRVDNWFPTFHGNNVPASLSFLLISLFTSIHKARRAELAYFRRLLRVETACDIEIEPFEDSVVLIVVLESADEGAHDVAEFVFGLLLAFPVYPRFDAALQLTLVWAAGRICGDRAARKPGRWELVSGAEK